MEPTAGVYKGGGFPAWFHVYAAYVCVNWNFTQRIATWSDCCVKFISRTGYAHVTYYGHAHMETPHTNYPGSIFSYGSRITYQASRITHHVHMETWLHRAVVINKKLSKECKVAMWLFQNFSADVQNVIGSMQTAQYILRTQGKPMISGVSSAMDACQSKLLSFGSAEPIVQQLCEAETGIIFQNSWCNNNNNNNNNSNDNKLIY